MALVWQSKGVKFVGCVDNTISPYLKCWIKQGNTVVVGKIGEGTSKQLQSNWESPFEQDNAGSVAGKAGGLVQAGALEGVGVSGGGTLRTSLNSAQVWEGNQPITLNVTLNFDALYDAKNEVDDAITTLEEFASPEVESSIPISINGDSYFPGRIPGEVTMNIGRNFIWAKCIIEDIQSPLDGIRDKNGYLLSAEVSFQAETSRMINRSDIRKMRG